LLALDGRVDGLESRTAILENAVTEQTFALESMQRHADAGIAAAMALGGTVIPPDARFAISFNLATYRAEQGFSGSVVARVTDTDLDQRRHRRIDRQGLDRARAPG
jgi:hypothetical protein